jgi:FkbM family methyltransferase
VIDCGGIWLPEGEQHMVEWMTKKNQRVDGKLTYQWDKQCAAMKHCRQFRNAVDIGAHVGLWSMHLVKRFGFVHAFEPVEAHRQCFDANIHEPDRQRIALYPFALGERNGEVGMYTNPTSSGDSWVKGTGDIPLRRLDDFHLDRVDFIKVDCEGYELFALRGAIETILRCRPTICVEQKPRMATKFGLGETDAVSWLESLGAKLQTSISGDYILACD